MPFVPFPDRMTRAQPNSPCKNQNEFGDRERPTTSGRGRSWPCSNRERRPARPTSRSRFARGPRRARANLCEPRWRRAAATTITAALPRQLLSALRRERGGRPLSGDFAQAFRGGARKRRASHTLPMSRTALADARAALARAHRAVWPRINRLPCAREAETRRSHAQSHGRNRQRAALQPILDEMQQSISIRSRVAQVEAFDGRRPVQVLEASSRLAISTWRFVELAQSSWRSFSTASMKMALSTLSSLSSAIEAQACGALNSARKSTLRPNARSSSSK